MPLDQPAFTFRRAEIKRFIQLADFFCAYAGMPNQQLVAEFDRLRPELTAYIQRFRQQVGEE